MATTTTKKLLKDLLREQQEPFILHVHLAERRFLIDRQKSRVKRTKSVKETKKDVLKTSKLLGNVYKRVWAITELFKIKYWDKENGKHKEAETFQSTCVSQSLKQLENEEISIKTNVEGRDMEESRQNSPMSVLEDITSHSERLPEHGEESCTPSPKSITEESILSASIWTLLHSTTNKPNLEEATQQQLQDLVQYPFPKSKQRKNRLLFDLVKEAVEMNGKGFVGFEEMGNIILERIKVWGNETSISELFLDSEYDYERCDLKREIGVEIGDAIFEHLLYQIVQDLIGDNINLWCH